jgi:asparagine synthase (glutamine-hydrolysing)
MQVAKADADPDTRLARWHAEWLVTFGPRDRASGAEGQSWVTGATALSLARYAGSAVQVAADETLVVVFSGVLVNAAELSPGAELSGAARIVADRYRSHGEDAFDALRGPFAAIVWERERGRLVVARDQVGIEPIFYARHGETWHWSPSPDVLASQRGVSRDPDAVALCEWLCGWFPAVEDTSCRDVKRVPPATVLTVTGDALTARRYWDPWPDGEPVEWLNDKDVEQIDPLLERAVDRTLRAGPSAVFLSGGVDSIAVAAAATDLERGRGRAAPRALSLIFPDARSNEAPIQRAVAGHLGMVQELVPLTEAEGPDGLVAGALALSAGWPQPMWNIWAPAYMELARRAAFAGCDVVLTGRGGDEWFTISPYLLADLLGRGDLIGALRFLRMRSRSNGLGGIRGAAGLVWTTAGRSLGSAALATIAPGRWQVRRRRRLLSERPAWVAPDPAIRRAMDERVERWMDPARPDQGFYVREARTAVRHPAVTHDMEETQEFGRRFGLRLMHPFWDVDLVSALSRVPPAMLMGQGRSKCFLRRRLAARFPGLGLATRGKITAGHVFQAALQRDATTVLARLGGPRSLARIGAVAVETIESRGRPQEPRDWGGPGRLWTLLTLETWVRRRHEA